MPPILSQEERERAAKEAEKRQQRYAQGSRQAMKDLRRMISKAVAANRRPSR